VNTGHAGTVRRRLREFSGFREFPASVKWRNFEDSEQEKLQKIYILFTDELANLMVRDAAATLLYMKITSENLKGGNTINILQIIIGIIIVYILIVESPVLLRRVILLWRWHRVKKTGMNFQKYMYDFFSKITLRENEFCRDCKYSEISKNNGNLICLNEKSDNFGAAVAPENEERGFCYFERK